MEFKNKLDAAEVSMMDAMFDEMLDDSMNTNIGDSSYTEEDGATDKEISPAVKGILDKVNGEKETKSSIFINGPKTFDEKTLEEKLSDIYEEYKADTTITLSNIRDISFRTAAIRGRWCSRMMAERVRYRRLKENLDTLKTELGKMVDEKAKTSSYLTAKMNRDKLINENEEVRKLLKEMYESKVLQDYFTYIHENLKDLCYVVKNSLQVLELERGI